MDTIRQDQHFWMPYVICDDKPEKEPKKDDEWPIDREDGEEDI